MRGYRRRVIDEPQQHSRLTVAVAESCTGGLLATRIVETPGSGEWFKGGLVAYDAEVKHHLLGVTSEEVINRGAAMEMAEGARELLEADIGVATTGVAGPDTEEGQPVGTVFVGVSVDGSTQSLSLSIEGGPDEIRSAAANHALQQVLHARSSGRGRSDPPSHELAVPEGGFVIVSPYPLEDVTIVDDTVSFTVPDQTVDPIVIELSGLDRTEFPEVSTSEGGAEPASPGNPESNGSRTIRVTPGRTIGITWKSSVILSGWGSVSGAAAETANRQLGPETTRPGTTSI
jgi:nicotinamide-nucleotide amidase